MIHKRHRTPLSRFLEGRTAGFYHLWFSVILVIGAVMDRYLTGLWLPRAGAIVAGVAAYVYFFDPRTTDDWWMMQKSAMPGVLLAELAPEEDSIRARAQSATRARVLEQMRIAKALNEMAESQKISYFEAKEAHQRMHDLALRVQAYWLFIGTIIWAFGDIPVELLKCGRVPC